MASYPQNGITLKALLEIPFVMNPPQIQQNPNKVKDVDEEYDPFSGQSAFLGPNLWDHTLPYDANNLKLEYMDLDEFLQENGIPVAPDQGAFQLPQPNQPQIQNSPNPNHLPNPQNPNQIPSQALLQQLRQQLQQQQQLQQMRGNISPHLQQQAEQQPQQLHQPQLQQLQQLQRQQPPQQHQQLRSNISPQQQQHQEPQHSPKQSQKMPALLSMKDIHPPVPPTSEVKTPKQPPTPTIPVPVPVAPHSDGHVKQEDDGTSTCSNCSLPELISPSPPQKSPTSVKSPPPASDPPSSGPPSAVPTPSQGEGEGDDSGDETETESMIDSGEGEDGGGEDFDPKKRVFNDDDLRPQPMIKKSKKVFVPEEMKDTKYWMRRRKNNLAAKRSRDARRTKENQIIMRAAYLEHENDALHVQVEKMEKENRELRKKLSKYESSASSS